MPAFERYLTDEFISTETCMAKVKFSEKTATIWQKIASEVKNRKMLQQLCIADIFASVH
jgi:hypothetical protein